MQASLEAEVRSRSEAVRLRKKMESDLNEMEVQLGHANRQAAESQRVIRHLQTQVWSLISGGAVVLADARTSDGAIRSLSAPCWYKDVTVPSQVKEHQVELEDKVQLVNQQKEQVVLLERRCSLMTAEEEELRGILEQTDRARKMAEHELVEVAERVNLLTTQVLTHGYRLSLKLILY